MSSNNEESTSNYQLKIKVINLIELAYKSNGDLTASIVKDRGRFSLRVDHNGRAKLSGKAGVVRFSATEEVNQFGLDLKLASIMFFGTDSEKIRYTATFKFAGGLDIKFSSSLDVEKLVLSCSGLLCRAARSLKQRHKMIDKSLPQ